MNRVQVQLLRSVFERIIDKLESQNLDYVDVVSEAYRYIPTDKWDDFTSDTVELGSLEDDLQALARMASQKEVPCTYVDFDRTAAILRAISQALNPPSY